MAASAPHPSFDLQQQPSQEIRQLWKDVENGLETNQTVDWRKGFESLETAGIHYSTGWEAKGFAERSMKKIIGFFLEQDQAKISSNQKYYIEESLGLGLAIVCQDLKQFLAPGNRRKAVVRGSQVLDTLGLIFDPEMTYYKSGRSISRQGRHRLHSDEVAEVRIILMDRFRHEYGYRDLTRYLKQLMLVPEKMPSLEFLHIILWGLGDLMHRKERQEQNRQERQSGGTTVEEAAFHVSEVVVEYLNCFSSKERYGATSSTPDGGSALHKLVRSDVRRIYDKLGLPSPFTEKTSTTRQPSADDRKIWKEVANDLDKSQTVVWESAVISLRAANFYFSTSPEARAFAERCLKQMIGILVDQKPTKVGQFERACVEESLALGVAIVRQDLKLLSSGNQRSHPSTLYSSNVLDALVFVFDRKRAYFHKNVGWNRRNDAGLPEVRIKMMHKFRLEGGYRTLATYLRQRVGSPGGLPSFHSFHVVLWGLGELLDMQQQQQKQQKRQEKQQQQQDTEQDETSVGVAAILISQAVMEYMNNFTDEMLRGSLATPATNTKSNNSSSRKAASDEDSNCLDFFLRVRADMQRIYDKVSDTHRSHTYGYYHFWRALVIKLIRSTSLPLRLKGWEQLKALIEASLDHRPPPKHYVVEGAGTAFVNGIYSFGSTTTPDGYMRHGAELTYKCHVPWVQAMEHENSSGAAALKQGKTLTLFRCTMRSQQKWWFLSEVDEEHPGTDKDIDYYRHKPESKELEERQPPPSGWKKVGDGQEPPPTLHPKGVMVPKGQEYQTLEHHLARWALEQKIIEHVFVTSVHREVVAGSAPLIEFLASMCERDADPRKNNSNITSFPHPGPNAYCLSTSHLILTWRMCTSKADDAVSEEICQLLAGILPTLPNSLAVPLLQTMLTSARQSHAEVADFLSALANRQTAIAGESRLGNEKRSEIVNLLWAVYTSSDPSPLNHEDVLKTFLVMELKDPTGQGYREKLLESCTKWLASNSVASASVNEVMSMRMIKLTHIVLEAYPREQAQQVVAANGRRLASSLFVELIAFFGRAARRREQQQQLMGTGEKGRRNRSLQEFPSAGSVASEGFSSSSKQREGVVDFEAHVDGLKERLVVLRYIHGVSSDVKISIKQLRHLWSVGSTPKDREEVMVFVAGAAQASSDVTTGATSTKTALTAERGLHPAFSDDVRTEVFLELFCSRSVSWENLGTSAYDSFQAMFRIFRQSPGSSNALSMDALWRICWTAGDEAVVARAMEDLLNVYVAIASERKMPQTTNKPRVEDEANENFGQRILDCLTEVQTGLEAGDRASERSAERCLRILSASTGEDLGGSSMTTSVVASLSALPPNASLAELLRRLPHGMRGQACYRRVGVVARRSPQQHQPDKSDAPVDERNSSPLSWRFSLEVHPLETLASVKAKLARCCSCEPSNVKLISVSGKERSPSVGTVPDSSQLGSDVATEDSIVDQLGIVEGCEMVFAIVPDRIGRVANRPAAANESHRALCKVLDISDISSDRGNGFASKLSKSLLSLLEALPWDHGAHIIHNLAWEVLLALPTNSGVADRVLSTAGGATKSLERMSHGGAMSNDTAFGWGAMIAHSSFQRSVYVMQTINAFLQPAPEALSILPSASRFDKPMTSGASSFRRGFVESGGFDAVIRFFGAEISKSDHDQRYRRMANAAALRILLCCLLGSTITLSNRSLSKSGSSSPGGTDDIGRRLLGSLKNVKGLLQTLTSMVVDDEGISGTAVMDVLRFLRILLLSQSTTEAFVADRMGQKLVMTLLLWERSAGKSNFVQTGCAQVRKQMQSTILTVPLLFNFALRWLMASIDQVEVNSASTAEYYDVLVKLASQNEERDVLQALGNVVCQKLLACAGPSSGLVAAESTGTLCGCLKLLKELVEKDGDILLPQGTACLVKGFQLASWSDNSSNFDLKLSSKDSVLVDLIGAVFDGLLSPIGFSSAPICFDKESRQYAFDTIAAAARSCHENVGSAVISVVLKHLRTPGSDVPAEQLESSTAQSVVPEKHDGTETSRQQDRKRQREEEEKAMERLLNELQQKEKKRGTQKERRAQKEDSRLQEHQRKREEKRPQTIFSEARIAKESDGESRTQRQEREPRHIEEHPAHIEVLKAPRREQEAGQEDRRTETQSQQGQGVLRPFLTTLARAQECELARSTGQSSTRARLVAESKSLRETIALKTGFYDMPSIRARRSAQSRLAQVDELLSNEESNLYPTAQALQKEAKILEQSIDELMSLILEDTSDIPVLEGLSAALEAVNCRLKKEQETDDEGPSTNLGTQAMNVPQGIKESRERLSRVMNDRSLDPVEISISYLQFCTNDFQETLGAGGFGFVFLGTDPEIKRRFAVKRVDLPLSDLRRLKVAKDSVKKEIAALMRFRHPNIIALYGTNLSRSTTQYLVYELAEKGSVADFLRTEELRAQLSGGTRLGIIFQTCRAVNFLHTGGCDNIVVFHRDIKSDNICLTKKDTAKLIDCGVAKFVVNDDESDSRIESVITGSGIVRCLGTRGYMDLGYASGIRDFDATCDVFSIGVTIAELVTGTLQLSSLGDFCSRYSFDLDQELDREGWRVLKNDADIFVEWNEEMLTELTKLAVQCMSQSRAKRPTLAEVLQKLCWLCHQEHLGSVHPASTVMTIPTNTSLVSDVPHCSLCNRGRECVNCSEGHFTCVECLEDAVRCAMHSDSGRESPWSTTEIRCPFSSCKSAPFQDHMLFGKVSLDLYTNLMKERSLCGAMNGAFAQMMQFLQDISLDMCQGFAQVNQNLDEVQMSLKQNIQVQEVLLKKISGGLSRSLQALAYVTAGETAKCPRLVWLVPARAENGTVAVSRNPKEWAHGLFVKKYHIYLICQHSMTPVDPPLEISVHRKWLVQAAPALKASLMVLRTATAILSGLPFPIPTIIEKGVQLQMENEFVGELLPDAARAALENCESSIFNGDDEVVDELSREVQKLVGSAFRLIAEKANKPKRSHWKEKMVPVVNSEGTAIWVKKEYQRRYM